MEDGNQPVAVNFQEGEMITPLQATPFKTPLKIEGHASSLRQGVHLQFDEGTQRETSRKITIETVETVMAPEKT